MHSDQPEDRTRKDAGSGFPIQGIIALTVIALGVLALILKALGIY